MSKKHNHITRGFMDYGECPACDDSYYRGTLNTVEEMNTEIHRLNRKLSESQAHVKILKDFASEAEKLAEFYSDVEWGNTYIKFDMETFNYNSYYPDASYDKAGKTARQFLKSETYKNYKKMEEEC